MQFGLPRPVSYTHLDVSKRQTVPNPDEGNFLDYLNPDSLKVLTGCKVERALGEAQPGESYQFLRQGYFCVDSKDSKPGALVFNRSVKLKDSFKPEK